MIPFIGFFIKHAGKIKAAILALLAIAFISLLTILIVRLRNSEDVANERNAQIGMYNDSLMQLKSENQAYVQALEYSITQEQAKEMIQESLDVFNDKLKLKAIDHYAEIKTTTTNYINTLVRDSVIIKNSDTIKAKIINYSSNNLKLTGYLSANDSLYLKYTNQFDLYIATGKQQRKGWFKKITLQPIKRVPIVQAYTSDSCTKINKIFSTKIN